MKIIKNLNKANVSWALYDWANSAYATTVLAVFFPVFLSEYWSEGADPSVTTSRLGAANSLAGLIIMAAAPVLGTLSDISPVKKKYLAVATITGAISTAAMFFVPGGAWIAALALFTLSSVCFSAGIIFYDALINSVAEKKLLNFVSGVGYSFGYLGGGILLAVNIFTVTNYEFFGLSSSTEAIKYVFVSVGVWWIIFAVPLFLNVKEKHSNKTGKLPFINTLTSSLRQLKITLSQIKEIRSVWLFLIAYWLYIDGVDTIIRMAMDFGLSIGLERNSLITALLITQFVGFPSALITGIMFKGGKGARTGIFITICAYFMITLLGAMMRSELHFYMLAVSVGLVQGGIQALSRSYYASIIPENKEGEFFGFYNMIGKFAVILGPLFIAGTNITARQFGFSQDTASRCGVLSVAVFFILGGIIFYMSGRDRQG
jgi:MFS transporter, UMF1 family